MAPREEEDWSDSDEDVGSDVETSVQLGVPDGLVDSSTDLLDAAVSRIGGNPAFLSSPEPPIESALCRNCSTPMELLVQVWCPLENSPNDRALYVWGCARGTCQRLEGSVRAWRNLRHNAKYAAKLEKKLAEQKEKEEARARAAREEEERRAAAKVNPFSMKGHNVPNPFGMGVQVFGEVSAAPEDERSGECLDGAEEASSSKGDDADESEVVTALAAASLDDSKWASAPAYSPLYMSTAPEYLPPAPKPKLAADVQASLDDEPAKGKDSLWGLEGYENSMEVDHVFERFTKRVSYDGEQCLRYELGGAPLPFANDKVFDRLFPAPAPPNLPVTKPDFMVQPPAPKRTFDPSSLPPCPSCKGRRVFECQLMPNLINVLKMPVNKTENSKKLTDEERRRQVERALKSGGQTDRVGMEWGTCMIFTCEKDCCLEGGENAKSCWREEVVLIQWDN